MILYLDCDTGVDDALALAFLLAAPQLRVAGVGTVSGNTAAEQAAANTLALLALAGRDDIPVAVGAREPLAGTYAGGAGAVHGGNGIGGVRLPPAERQPDPRDAPTMLIDLARAYPGELHVLSTGPLTNLALALAADPGLAARTAAVTAMGGAVRVPGNITGHAEANIGNDPEAAAAVLAAPWPVTLIPLDVTMWHRFDEGDRDAIRAGGSPLQAALADMLGGYFDYYEPVLGERRVPLHDPLAAAVAVGEVTPADAPVLGLRVDTTDQRGRLVLDPTSAGVRVVLGLTAPAAPAIRRRLAGPISGRLAG